MFRRALWLNIPGLFLVVTICALDGMVIFATYADCDLKEQGKITRGDQVENGAQSLRESVGQGFILMLHIVKVVCGFTRLSLRGSTATLTLVRRKP